MQRLVDIHCHIIPEVDDGAASIRETANLLQKEYQDGVTEIILTPHFRRGMFETPQDVIEKQFAKVQRMVQRSRTGMKVYLGCEYHMHPQMVQDLNEGRRPTMAGSRYVLLEFSSLHSYAQIRNQVYVLAASGYVPIIAHVERYPCLLKRPVLIRELCELGAKIQLTSDSVLGEEGWRIRQFCRLLLKEHCVDYIATDAHNMRERSPQLQKCARYIESKFGEKYAEKIFIRNPRKIIKDGKER